MRPSTITIATLAAVAAATASASAATVYRGVSGFSDEAVVDAPQSTYRLRASYLYPSTWRAAKASPRAIARRFGPVGSCRFKITVRARAVADVDEPAAARVARLLPASGPYLAEQGTRNAAAWRVVRQKGSDVVTGTLVRPAPSVKSQPAGRRIWLELTAAGTADPNVECHAGGPRSVAAGFGLLLASGGLGGFQL